MAITSGSTNSHTWLMKQTAKSTEYFFEAPATLKQKHPDLYEQIEHIFRQDTAKLFRGRPNRPKRIGRNQPCPCGSGQKFKRCCRRSAKQGIAA